MSELRTHIDNNGRVLIPSSIRKKYNIKKDDVFVIRAIEGEIHLISLDKAVQEMQDLIKQYVPEGVSLVDELAQERRQAYLMEEERLK